MPTNSHDKSIPVVERIVGEAEKEASEVLHSLLSVERIEKPNAQQRVQNQVVVLSNGDDYQWHDVNNIQQQRNVFSFDNDNHNYSQQDNIVWDNSMTLDVETTQPSEHTVIPNIPEVAFDQSQTQKPQVSKIAKKHSKKSRPKLKKNADLVDVNKTVSEETDEAEDSIEVDDNENNVRKRFSEGCDCGSADSCFRGLNPEVVYRHRLNIAELTKEEHDMYLMGVTMACISDPGMTVRRRERQRLRAQYVYQGRRVCLSAFLYLENCTLYQLKRIRKHLMTHGVTPRVHGNYGRKPHNVFSLETYRRAITFLKDYIDQYNTTTGNCKNTVLLPPQITKKTVHKAYLEFMRKSEPPDEKLMGYSTFRHFLKEQFPHVKFYKVELGMQNNSGAYILPNKQQQSQPICQNSSSHRGTNTEEPHTLVMQSQATDTPVQTMTAIPLLIQEQSKPEMTAQTAYIVTPVSQLVQAPYRTAHTITVTPATNYIFTAI